ncbi:hypothetical protein [Silvanigrella aquatica]|uniref:Uncharacterized protein n=1 Tax=Silvanigrella aquatica TaxID=1915309 RepID=A0A1L4D3E2_9BACT|nr:hypothetical protein [Silvanigrella aquatica]APJ04711.1 hypothetical protein AXG55_12690 [Silvanigrella aquatica]
MTARSKIKIVSIVRNFISKEHYNPSSYGITDLFSFHLDKNYYNEINAHIENKPDFKCQIYNSKLKRYFKNIMVSENFQIPEEDMLEYPYTRKTLSLEEIEIIINAYDKIKNQNN